MVKVDEYFHGIIKVNTPKRTDIWVIRFLIVCGLVSMTNFILWFINPEHIGYEPIYWLLTFALLFKLVKMLHEWYHYWSPSIPVVPPLKTHWTADVLTTSCPGEPNEMIICTLKAMKAIRYPHVNYLCDEGDDPVLKKVCRDLGIVHVTRVEKTNAKAGNINNALKQCTGDICVVLDPDHVPVPEFLDRVLPYFEDPEIGYVQCVQAYGNQSESIIAKGAAEQTYHFYGPMMMCMNTYGTAQTIGANCTFRRKALDSIGGHAAGLSEDMHTAMQLHAKGWKSVYVPEILTRGLVPATLSAYYQQQLKWTRGTFELLFRIYPVLFKNFTWRQKVHYFALPLYFLFGFVNFIDIIIPILALSLAQVPWEVNLTYFSFFFFPLLSLSMIIRVFAQRWLLEKHERGFHLSGGILRTATWWIFLLGFIYSILNIRVPYIPTPKNDEHQNYWKLSIPNLLVTLVCGVIVVYGLSIDWTPYSMAMALYALINAGMLGLIVIMSQQRFLSTISQKVKSFYLVENLAKQIGVFVSRIQEGIYGITGNVPVAIVIGASLLLMGYYSRDNEMDHSELLKQKSLGGFYSGIALSEDNSLKDLMNIENSINATFSIISFEERWDENNSNFHEDLMNAISNQGAIPMVVWKPNSINNKICQAITNGDYDNYLKQYSSMLRSYAKPVFIDFAPGFDDAENSWSRTGNNTPKEFREAWQYIYIYINSFGISNVTWVWNPKYNVSLDYYPGTDFVDWIGISCLNYSDNKGNKDWHLFSELYRPFRKVLDSLDKPIMIAQFGTLVGSDQSLWLNNALKDIKENFREIKSVILYSTRKSSSNEDKQHPGVSESIADFSFLQQKVIATLADNFKEKPFSDNPFIKSDSKFLDASRQTYHSRFIQGSAGHFNLLIKGEPYYIRGVAYNTAHDWRDGNMPLTRRQLEKDFSRIKAMGANTIRRYGYGIYDKNVLNIAKEYKLNVVYGFWFDPDIDYYKDSLKVKEYIRIVEEKVMEYKTYSSVLAWALGNETWGLLKYNYSKPYLTKVREYYVKFIELLAQRIHELDPSRPVFSCMENGENQLPGEILAFHDGAPSVDVIGVNSYYLEQISRLNNVAYRYDSLRPYLVSEFGPRGYWNPHYNREWNDLLIEDSDCEKAEWYKKQWNNYVIAFKGYNVGGFAYCWHDRMEGSCTWFGLTDYKGRTKPSYYALKELWTREQEDALPHFSIEAPQILLPGKKYTFKAAASMKLTKALNYEWYLHKADYLDRVDNVEYSDDGAFITVKIPEEPSNYRLYLYVSDRQGKVTTASLPIHVK